MNKSAEELIGLIKKESDENISLKVLEYYKSLKKNEVHSITSDGIMINQFTPEQGNTL